MVADSLTKALGRQVFLKFIDLVGLVDLEKPLSLLRREEQLKEQLMKSVYAGTYALGRDLRDHLPAQGLATLVQ